MIQLGRLRVQFMFVGTVIALPLAILHSPGKGFGIQVLCFLLAFAYE